VIPKKGKKENAWARYIAERKTEMFWGWMPGKKVGEEWNIRASWGKGKRGKTLVRRSRGREAKELLSEGNPEDRGVVGRKGRNRIGRGGLEECESWGGKGMEDISVFGGSLLRGRREIWKRLQSVCEHKGLWENFGKGAWEQYGYVWTSGNMQQTQRNRKTKWGSH